MLITPSTLSGGQHWHGAVVTPSAWEPPKLWPRAAGEPRARRKFRGQASPCLIPCRFQTRSNRWSGGGRGSPRLRRPVQRIRRPSSFAQLPLGRNGRLGRRFTLGASTRPTNASDPRDDVVVAASMPCTLRSGCWRRWDASAAPWSSGACSSGALWCQGQEGGGRSMPTPRISSWSRIGQETPSCSRAYKATVCPCNCCLLGNFVSNRLRSHPSRIGGRASSPPCRAPNYSLGTPSNH
jgi:hypothetical protein